MAAKEITPKDPCCGKCGHWRCFTKQVDYDGITWGECWYFDTAATADEDASRCPVYCGPGDHDTVHAACIIEN